MHRFGELDIDMFTGLRGKTEKVSIYEKFVDWVLKYRRPEWLTTEQIRARKRALKEMGLCVVHSGEQSASISVIEERLKEDEAAQDILTKARHQIEVNPVRTSIVSFYFKTSSRITEKQSKDKEPRRGSIEFIHASFSEFLFSERLLDIFEDWTVQKKAGGYYISDEVVSRQIYEMLGYGELTHEIVEFLIGLLIKKLEPNKWRVLFQRLQGFYIRWSSGEFIELVRKRTQIPLEQAYQFQMKDILVGQRQVDIFTGLNVLIILFSISRTAQQIQDKKFREVKRNLVFHPCVNQDLDDFDETRLQRIISYSECLRSSAFTQIVGGFMSGANLSNISLQRVNLSGASLDEANLSKTDLRRADLSGANLYKALLKNAYLRGADLDRANLKQADLTKADLKRTYFVAANLSGANLTKADLCGAELRDSILFDALLIDADLPGANLTDIKSDLGTRWLNVRGLHKANGIHSDLKNDAQFSDAIQLSEAVEHLLKGNIQRARSIYAEVNRKVARWGGAISASLWNKLAWISSLYSFNDSDVISASERAVKMEPARGNYRDTLAVAYAMSNRFEESIEQFERACGSKDFEDWDEISVKRRNRWVLSLKKGINPFSPHELSELLREELE